MKTLTWMMMAQLLLAAGLCAQAAPNEQVRFQGRLTDTAGAPVTTSTSVRFRLYTQPTGGAPLWEETQNVVPNATGVFTANLGAVLDFGGIDFSQVLYVGLAFGTDGEMTPRYLLTAAVSAQYARNAANLGGLPAGAFAQLSGAAFTGSVSAPTFTGSLAGNASSATTANTAADASLLGGNNSAFYLNRANHTGSMPSSALTGNLPALNASALTNLNAGALTGTLPALNAANLTGITGANVTGTVASATNATQLGGQAGSFYLSRANHTGTMPSSALSGALPALDGSALTNLSGASVTGAVGNSSQLLGATWASPQAIGATTPGSGAFTTLSAGGTTTLNGEVVNTVSAASPTAIWTGNRVNASVSSPANQGRGFAATLAVSGAPTAPQSGAFIDATSGGNVTQGLQGRGAYNGAAAGTDVSTHYALGVVGNAASPAGASVLASGVYGSAESGQSGSNVGLYGVGRTSLGRNLGLFATANSSDVDQVLFGMTLPANLSAAMLGFNNLAGANDYGLFVSAANNRIAGNLTVTGTISGTFSGTVNNANNLENQPGSFYLNRASHTGLLPGTALGGTYAAEAHFTNPLNSYAGNGAGLTGVNSATLNSFDANFLRERANHFGLMPSAALTGALPALDGAALTNLTGAQVQGAVMTASNALNLDGLAPSFYRNAGSLDAGTLDDARLGGNVALYSRALNPFSGDMNIGGVLNATGMVSLGNDAGTPTRGELRLHDTVGANALIGTLRSPDALTVTRTWTLPDNSGTLALLSDIPTGGGGPFLELAGGTMAGSITFAGSQQLPSALLTGALPALDGAALTGVNAALLGGQNSAFYRNATNLNAGTIADGLLSAGVISGVNLALGATDLASPGTIARRDSAGGFTTRWLDVGASGNAGLVQVRDTTGSPTVLFDGITGNVIATGTVSGANFTGSGAGLTNLDASELSGAMDAVPVGQSTPAAGAFTELEAGGSFKPPRLSSDPASAADGTVYYNTTTDSLRIRTDGAWRDAGVTEGTIVFSESPTDAKLLGSGYARAATHDTGTSTVTPVSLDGANAPSARGSHTAVWTGSQMLVWGGHAGTNTFNTGAGYDPVTDAWSTIPVSGGFSARTFHTTIWTNTEMIVWGGSSSVTTVSDLGDGARYNPATSTWAPIPVAGAPSARRSHTAVWSGSEMIVWGGLSGGSNSFNDGGRYAPGGGWTAIPGSPLQARHSHTAIWTGSEVIVWGGFGLGGPFANGARYNPVTSTWVVMNSTGAPSGRALHAAVWTGTEMIIWGGEDAGGALSDGARYHVGSDSWAPIASGPVGRSMFPAVWTGQRMVLWGGLGGSSNTLGDGAAYDPSTNQWATLATTAAPGPRHSHSGVWTGAEFIVWGGSNPQWGNGGRYDPATDTWLGNSQISGLFAYRAP